MFLSHTGNNNRKVMATLEWSYRLIRWILGVVFIYTGSTKLMDPSVFGVLIEAYGIVPESLVPLLAVTLPLLEMTAGIGLVFDIKGGLAMITGLLVLFIAVIGYGIHIGLDVDCGCFGPEDPEAKSFHGLKTAIYRDLLMLTGTCFAFGWRKFQGICPRPFIYYLNLYRVIKKENTA